MKKYWVLICVFCSLTLFVLATIFYPGGTAENVNTIGYYWAKNTISALFQPNALNGDVNSARYFAISSVLIYCVSLAFMFKSIAKNAATAFHRKTIEIAGIGFAVYAFFIVTPMHNLMVVIALLFFVVTVLTLLHNLYLQKKMRLFAIGLISVSMPLINAAIYYGDFFNGMLPLVQKTGTFACAIWFVLIYYSEFDLKPKGSFQLDPSELEGRS
ncbi:MAG: hypothetical protein WEA58_02115 [Balneolaceae bacterium]